MIDRVILARVVEFFYEEQHFRPLLLVYGLEVDPRGLGIMSVMLRKDKGTT